MRFVAIFLLALGHFLPAQGATVESPGEKERKILAAYANALKTAVMVKDHEGLVSFQYPELVEEAGGKEKVIERLKAEEAKDKEAGWKTEWLELAPTNTIYAGSEFKVTFVPSITFLKGKTTGMWTKSFQIAFAKLDSNRWYFRDGTRLTTTQFRSFYTGLPEDLELPAVEINAAPIAKRWSSDTIVLNSERRFALPSWGNGAPSLTLVLPAEYEIQTKNSADFHVHQIRHPKDIGVLSVYVGLYPSFKESRNVELIPQKFGKQFAEFRKRKTEYGSFADALITDFFAGDPGHGVDELVLHVFIQAQDDRFYDEVWKILESVEKAK